MEKQLFKNGKHQKTTKGITDEIVRGTVDNILASEIKLNQCVYCRDSGIMYAADGKYWIKCGFCTRKTSGYRLKWKAKQAWNEMNKEKR